ncbi:universal stress protein [Halorussus halophilus]|uniref:universal stress protein n=1 Tax=Halorussus halophilus TaxID=2650975 RepID=UPI00130175FD|nr:universal stress protein [Halorussus halophilus]
MYDRVLVPTDGSEESRRAATHGVELASRFGGLVRALYVVDDRYSGLEFGDADGDPVTQALEHDGEEATEAVENAAAERRVEATSELREGIPADAILDAIAEWDADLVVMGTHGRTGLEHFLVGSTAERVVRYSPVPVLTVRANGQDATDYETIVVATDGSEPADDAITEALTVANAYDATVHVLSVVDTRLSQSAALLESLEIEAKNAVSDAIEQVTTDDEDGDVDVTTTVMEGVPAAAIVDYAADNDADLLVVGTRGVTGLDRFVTGSTAERVVRTSPVPVLTVPAEESKNEE